jgi:hypothetical protein
MPVIVKQVILVPQINSKKHTSSQAIKHFMQATNSSLMHMVNFTAGF